MKTIFKNLTQIRFFGMYLSIALVLFSAIGFFTKGMNLGIDFTGGFITEFSTSRPVEQSSLKQILAAKIDGQYVLTSSLEGYNWIVRQPDTNTDQTENAQTFQSWKEELVMHLASMEDPIQVEVLDSDFIGTQVGKELIEQGGLAMLGALVIIMIYLTARFEWRFGTGAILALFHDVIVVLGIFSWLQLEFNLTVLASLLAIIGYSLNDSIIVSDRIRELMRQAKHDTMTDIINCAIKDTFTRTLITSGTTLTTIACIWWLAGKPLMGFSVALFSGIVLGTLSSICIAATIPQIAGLKVNYYQLKAERDKQLNEAP